MIGPKKVEWTPIANKASSSSGIATPWTMIPCQAINSPAAPTSMIAISHALTMRMIRALSRASASWPDKRREQEEGQDEDAGGDRAEPGLRGLVIIDLVDDEQHHRVLEQIVVERAEQLGDEQGQEAARAEQMGGAVIRRIGLRQRRRMPGQ